MRTCCAARTASIPVSALEIEYSLACRFIESEILPAARELGVGIVVYRVLADGLLSGAVTNEPPGGASRLTRPRLQGENLTRNVDTTSFLTEMAAQKRRTPAQLAVAWLLTRGDDILPLVGMSRPGRLAENVEVLDVQFSPEEMASLDFAFAPGAIVGDRYPDFVQKYAAK